MQHAGADEEYQCCLTYPHYPQCLERGVSAGLGEVGGRGDWRRMYVAVFSLFCAYRMFFLLKLLRISNKYSTLADKLGIQLLFCPNKQ